MQNYEPSKQCTKISIIQLDKSCSTKKKVFFSQYLASITLSIVSFTVGLANGWSSPYLAQLSLRENIDGIPRASDEQLTWVASFINIGRLVGAVVGAVAQDNVGRKMTLFFAGIPLMSGWLCIAAATSIEWLYTARLFCGIGWGIIRTTMSLYLAEIADPEIRGSLVLWNITSQSIGLFVGNLMGPYISMRWFAYVSLLPNALFLVLFPMIPDSPYRYVMDGQMDKAEKSLQWFRRRADVKRELLELQDYIGTSTTSFKGRLKELKEPKYLKSFGIIFMINVFNFFGAYNVLTMYMEIIVTKSKVSLTPSTIVSAVCFFSIISGLLATYLVDRFGRRLLLIGSGFGMAFSLTCLGIHFRLLDLDLDQTSAWRVALSWLPCACLLLYMMSFSAGYGCIPSTLVGELFSPGLKTIASLSFSGTMAIFSSLSTGTFVPFLNLLGPSYLFCFYAAGTYVSVAFYYFFVPETMGKSLKDIQNEEI